MRGVVTCSVEKDQNSSIFGMPSEIHGASLLFPKQNIVVTRILALVLVLALHYSYVRATSKCGSHKKALPIRESIDTPAAAVAAMV